MHIRPSLALSLAALAFIAATGVTLLATRPRLLRLKDPAAVDPSDGLVVVLNPLRRRAPERAAGALLRELRNGSCQHALGFLAADRRADLCDRERSYRIATWELRDRTDNGDQVKLFYAVYRLPSPTLATNVWITMTKTGGAWRPTEFECWY